MWVVLICLAVAAHYLLPESIRNVLIVIIGMWLITTIGTKIGNLEQQVASLEKQLDEMDTKHMEAEEILASELGDRLWDVEKALGKQDTHPYA